MHPTLAAAERLYRTLPVGHRPTRMHLHVLAKLAHWRSSTPTHRALARAARCSRRTVLRALGRLRSLGLLSWQPRTITGRGFAVRVANRYSFAATSLLPIRIPCSAGLSHPPAAAALADALRASEARVAAAWRDRPAVRLVAASRSA